MIARIWSGKVPIEHATGFHQHLLKTGVADYHRQPGCLEVRLWRRDVDGWAHFLMSSVWISMDAIRAYAGDEPELAVSYPEDDVFGLVPDTTVTHYEVVSLEEAGAARVPSSAGGMEMIARVR